MKIAIVVPTFNERSNIGPLLDSLIAVTVACADRVDLLVVDDESPDGTAEVVRERQRRDTRIHLLSAPRAGLGAAYARGIGHALAVFAPDVVVQMDADFSHSPQDIPRLLDAVRGDVDVAIGSRYVGGNRTPHDWGWRRQVLSWGGNLVARHWLGLAPIRDCTAGFRAWRATALRAIEAGNIGVQGYAFPVVALQRAVALGARVVEIPVHFPDRVRGNSKLSWADIFEFAHWSARNPSPFGPRP